MTAGPAPSWHRRLRKQRARARLFLNARFRLGSPRSLDATQLIWDHHGRHLPWEVRQQLLRRASGSGLFIDMAWVCEWCNTSKWQRPAHCWRHPLLVVALLDRKAQQQAPRPASNATPRGAARTVSHAPGGGARGHGGPPRSSAGCTDRPPPRWVHPSGCPVQRGPQHPQGSGDVWTPTSAARIISCKQSCSCSVGST